MKDTLTTAESQHLISLGVPKEKASGFEYIGELEYDVCDNYFDNPINKKAPIFTLTDLLEILPKEIGDRNRIIESGSKGHFAYYVGINGVIGWKPAEEELIDALYQLACWYYGEYLKSEEK